MNEIENISKPKSKSKLLFRWATFLFSALGFMALAWQLFLVSKQTSAIIEKLELDKKPHGSVKLIWPDDTVGLPFYLKRPTSMDRQPEDAGRFKIVLSHYVSNQGREKLILLGSIGIRTDSYIDFLESFLNGSINYGDIRFDESKGYLYRMDIIPGDARIEQHKYYNIPIGQSYFFSTLYFYEDISGNLYVTDHLDHLKVFIQKDELNESLLISDIEMRDTYHELSMEYRMELIRTFNNAPPNNSDSRAFANRLALKK